MAERVASRLRPDRETVRLVADGNRLQQLAAGRVDDVDDPVVAAREPQLFAVDAEIAHVGAPGGRDRPRRDDAARGKVDHRHAALADAGLAADPEPCSAIVFGSRKSRRFIASATMTADFPSGVKYML